MSERFTGMDYERGIASVAHTEYLQAEQALTQLQDEADRLNMAGQIVPPELQTKIDAATREFHRASDEWLDTSTEAHL